VWKYFGRAKRKDLLTFVRVEELGDSMLQGHLGEAPTVQREELLKALATMAC
jgi:hypothetical protein